MPEAVDTFVDRMIVAYQPAVVPPMSALRARRSRRLRLRTAGAVLTAAALSGGVVFTAGTLGGSSSDSSFDVSSSSQQVVAERTMTLLTTLFNIHNLPADPEKRRELVASAAFQRSFSNDMRMVWDPQVLVKERASWLGDVMERANTPQMEMQSAARFGKPAFESVRVHGNNAEVILTVRSERRSATSGLWIPEGRSRFVCRLHRSPDGQWRLITQTSTNLDGEG